MSDDTKPPSGGEVTSTLGFVVSGASLGAAIGNVPGAVIGGVFGFILGVGLAIAARNLKKDPVEDFTPPESERRRHPQADQGNPAPWVAGQFVRVPGQLIRMGPINDGVDDETNTRFYFTLLAVAWCRSQLTDIKRIYANGEIIWDNSVLTENDFFCSKVEYHPITGGPSGKGHKVVPHQVWYYIQDADWDPTDIWNADQRVSVTGGAGSVLGNTGSMKYLSSKLQGSTRILKFHKCSTTVSPNKPTTNNCGPSGIPVDQPSPGPYEYFFEGVGGGGGGGGSISGHLLTPPRHYLGTTTQAADGALAPPTGWVGTPIQEIAYRGTAYTVLDILLTKWGATVPRFEALVQVQPEPEDLWRVIERIAERGNGLRGVAIDTTPIQSAGVVRGLTIMGATTPAAAIQELMTYYAVEAIESFTTLSILSADFLAQLQFVYRDQGQVFEPPAADFGAREDGTSTSFDRAEITVGSDRDIPNHLVLNYIADEELDFQPATMEYINSASPAQLETTRVSKMNTDLVMSSVEAKQACEMLLHTMQLFRDSMKFTLPNNWVALRPNDRIKMLHPGMGETVECRLIRIARGQNGLLECEGMLDDTLVFDQIGDNDIPHIPKYSPSGPAPEPFVLDIAPLTREDAFVFGQYFVIGMIVDQVQPIGYQHGAEAPSTVTLYQSLDEQTTWSTTFTQRTTQIFGQVLDIDELGDTVDYAWDTIHKIQVELENPTLEVNFLESVPLEEVAGLRRNIAYIDGEIIGFADVVDLGDGIFELSMLLRGLLNSEDFIGVPDQADGFRWFLMLTANAGHNNSLRFRSHPLDYYKRFIWYRAVASTSTIDEDIAPSETFAEPEANTLRPFSPRSRWLRRHVDQSFTLYFKRRTRIPFRILSGVIAPRAETQNCFKIDIFWVDNPEREFIRTLCCCYGADDEYFMTYTREQIEEDFWRTGRITDGSLPEEFELELYQCSDTVGEGRRSLWCVVRAGSYVQFDPCPPPS